MPDPSPSTPRAVVCPHCSKEFEAEPMSGGSDRHQGFKCPHCRLFVAYARVEEQLEEGDSQDGGRVTR